jgi:aspartyl-tRNA(Asn)/glutamyl-tRNA(Gln) amidotransferase subunit A
MVPVELGIEPPNLALEWAMGNLATLLAELGDRWPGCAGELTDEVTFGLRLSQAFYNLNTAAAAEALRIQANEAMARAFDAVDFVIAATNPGPAFPADAKVSAPQTAFADWMLTSRAGARVMRGLLFGTRVAGGVAPRVPHALLVAAGRRFPDLVTMGALTIISNIYGNPAVSIPAGTIGGLPVGMQVLARHHADALLFDVALAAERDFPWPLVAPTVTAADAPVTSSRVGAGSPSED